MFTPDYQLLSGNNWKIWSGSGSIKYSAAVPGNIQNDLEQAGVLKPIVYGMGDPNAYDIPLDDWWYETVFEVKSLNKERIILHFDSVDYSCEVYLNDHLLGSHKGTFLPFSFDVTNVIDRGGKNTLRVKIDRMPPELYDWIIKTDGKNSSGEEGWFFVDGMNKERQLLGGLKPVVNFSYDWSTNVYTLGICKDVWLESCGRARVDALGISCTFSKNYDSVSIDATANVSGMADTAGKIRFSLSKGEDVVAYQDVPFTLKENEGKAAAVLSVVKPELWWPAGHGAQPLYALRAEIFVGDKLSHAKTEMIGLREIKWDYTDNAPADFPNRFLLVLNGKPIRTVGSNLSALDLYPGRATSDKAKQLIKTAVRGNLNTLRIHAGSGLMHDALFTEADRQGILMLVDYPLGNCAPETDEATLTMLRDTARILTRKYRCHPSIIEWCAGNELCWYGDPDPQHPALNAIRETMEQEDGTRVVRASCPVVGTRHGHYDYNPDSHYELYNVAGEMTDNVEYAPMMRNGEFAVHTPHNLESWYRFNPMEACWPFDKENSIMIRKNASYAIGENFWLNYPVIERMAGIPESLEQMISMGQYLAAEGIRYIIDSFRWLGKNMGGFTNWCYNEPFPNAAGTCLVDYENRPMMTYYFTREALAPVSIALKYDSCFYSHTYDTYAALRISSDAPERRENLRYQWKVRDNHGCLIRSGEGAVSIDPWETKEVDSVLLNPPRARSAGPVIVELSLFEQNGGRIAERTYLFSNRTANAPLMGLLNENAPDVDFGSPFTTTGMCGGLVRRTTLEVRLKSSSDKRLVYEITNTGENTALFPELHPLTEYRTDLYIDQNFTSIPPKESRCYIVETDGSFVTGNGLLGTGFYLTCFNAPRVNIPSERTVLYMGRRDDTCREYSMEICQQHVEANSEQIDPKSVSYLCKSRFSVGFHSEKNCRCFVSLAAADRSVCGVRGKVILNGAEQEINWPCGCGRQRQDPEQLSISWQESFPFDSLEIGENTLEVILEAGWFTWDALKIQAVE